MLIRQRFAADNPILLDIWLRSVRATHDFISEADIAELLPQVRDLYLPAVEVWVAVDDEDRPQGFIGLDQAHVEMLFIAPELRGQGIGTRLLDYARELRGRLSVDVNEQNSQAVGFYRCYGFHDIGRSETDGQDRPFPLLHMSL
ncbi:acetyltransferase [Pseudomonas sp. R3.Fl]|uniref:acetyltransferase n=1 Tax=Pseudomonas TaxID=286 RepID=UPI00201D5B7F|nr:MULTISPECIES: acetyltransferase [Pseudomonas]MCL6688323.1 acetyltransferase [Pseudomonas sp. R3.Fl]MCP1604327.1 putative acetyltransferase [Pseudomonas citronellolis]MCP1655150.1 putative acetyltransferase [Pseudomonas citronellolis]MCP1723343.1 putative acetyltransferase [Pseudomonas citronellolis]